MSCFELPLATCDDIRRLIANIWWGIEEGKKKMHWRSWDWLSTPKVWEAWGLGTFLFLIKQCLLNRRGDCSQTPLLFVLVS
jgi:hypothetical protein